MKLKKYLTIATISLATIIPTASAQYNGGSGVVFDSVIIIIIVGSIIGIPSLAYILKKFRK